MRKLMVLSGSMIALGAAPAPSPAVVTDAPNIRTLLGDSVIKPQSIALARDGQTALAEGKPADAFNAYEASATVDPKNRAAFIGMAKASQALGLPGRAVRFYREALALEPTDLAAIEGQGEALVQRGATARAQANLDRLKQLCGTCAQSTQLAVAIAKGPAQQTADASKTPEGAAKVADAPKADAKN